MKKVIKSALSLLILVAMSPIPTLPVSLAATFTLDPYLGDTANWEPLTAGRWSLITDGGDARYGINTTNFSNLTTSRLGEYSLVKNKTFGDFTFTAKVKTNEDFLSNVYADYNIVFGFKDVNNYYYMMYNRAVSETSLFKVVNGVRAPAIAGSSFVIPDNNYHSIKLTRSGDLISVYFDNVKILEGRDSTLGSGQIGIGGFNDSSLWDDIAVTAPTGGATPTPTPTPTSTPSPTSLPTTFTLDPYLGDTANWEPLTAGRWSLITDGGDARYGINTTNFSNLTTSRLGEYSLVKNKTFGDFTFTAKVKTNEDFLSNVYADYNIVFGFKDVNNYYYMMYNRAVSETSLFKVVNGVRAPAIAGSSFVIPDNNYHSIKLTRSGDLISVYFDNVKILEGRDSTLGSGQIGIGGFNDSSLWDDIAVTAPTGGATPTPTPTPTPAPAPSPTSTIGSLISDNFNSYSNGQIITSYSTYQFANFPYGGTSLSSNPSAIWEMDTGKLKADSGWGYTGTPQELGDRYFFRLNTRNFNVGDAAINWKYKSSAFGDGGYSVSGSDAVDLWVRYQTQYWLYTLQFDRTNNAIVVKKKIPAEGWTGPSNLIANRGVYYTLYTDKDQPIFGAGSQSISWDGIKTLLPASEQSKPGFPRLAHNKTTSYDFKSTVKNLPGGEVQIQIYRAGVLIGSWRDTSAGLATAADGKTLASHITAGYFKSVPGYNSTWNTLPITKAGATGFRADNIQAWFDDFQVLAL